MSASLETVRRLAAWTAGAPIPRGDVINVHVANDDDLFIVAFLRMGGESRPWGIAYGTIANGPTVLTVPEGRNRQLVGDMMATFAPVLLEHFRHPSYSEDGPAGYSTLSLRQMWLPGASHTEMLHFLASAYARSTWDRPDIRTLNALGNLANCLFIESQRPGQQTVITATSALRSGFVFPSTPIRQAHLGHLLGWLHGGDDRDARTSAAHEADKLSVSTVLDPSIERTVLKPLVTSWGLAQKQSSDTEAPKIAKKIHASLSQELTTRWNLVRQAAQDLRNDQRLPNSGLAALRSESAKQFYINWGEKALSEYAEQEPFWPNVFTDYSARSAGWAYQMRTAADQRTRHALVHGDRELQREELAAGHGVICTVTTVATDTPSWKVTFSYPELPTLKNGDNLVIAGTPLVGFEVRDIDFDNRIMILKPKWTRPKKNAGIYGIIPTSKDWRGKVLILVDKMPFEIDERRAAMTFKKKTSGSDITDLIVIRSRRHAALDDDGPVLASGDNV